MTGDINQAARRYDRELRDAADSVAAVIAEGSVRTARLLAAESPQSPPVSEPEVSPPPESSPAPWLRPFVGGLVFLSLAATVFAPVTPLFAHPWTFAALVVAVVALDLCRINVFERARVSPAAIPELALALVFGPLGPIAAEAVIAAGRAMRRERPVRFLFDFGAVSLASLAAIGSARTVALVGGGQMVQAVVAGGGLYAVNSVLVSGVLRLVHGGTVREVWREQFAWLWPHYLGIGALTGLMMLAARNLGASTVLIFGIPVLLVWIAERQYLSRTRRTVLALRERNAELEQTQAQLRLLLKAHDALLRRAHSSFLATIYALARTVRLRDPEAGGLAERASRAASAIGAELGLSENDCVALRLGVLVYDVGKVGLRPGESTTPEFYPEISCDILDGLDLPATVRQVVRSHLERYDGTGGPDGLVGEAIPLAARIAAVALGFDAYTLAASDDEYPIEAALAHIDAHVGSKYCPVAARALRECMQRDPSLRRYFGGAHGAAPPPPARIRIPQEVQ